ncbi:endo-1,3-alpha-glucanase family glycosylhydrolase [Nocardioides piscis]|uniref:Glycosyl hydrolase family 71 n=1 Tax=Nocardioides piscis TaxID=2714938 RepID=A0A6G7YBW1_9ACTN|nr:endo-1,3-alpha-glucanase family glycosylhydrolase [Nocardioides piscis]QIK74283.1 hypothetical protein G7071_01355 [Nocardioides piscis]
MNRLPRFLITVLLVLGTLGTTAPASYANDEVGFPVLAYYYIWYTPTSWDRAKTDLPLLGRYSSDEKSVMAAHARDAKSAGLDGFLVSWKHTPDLDRRLGLMVETAREHDLTLGIVYQGLDFFRRPLPPARVADDLRWFVDQYGDDPVFSVQGRPLVIWSGTWESTPRQIGRVTSQVRDRARVLASQRSAEEYDAVAPHVDGNAYYWSAMDPYVDTWAQERLDELSAAVHASGGLWIPSVSPGFDARLVGGHRLIERHDGDTLREEWRLAVNSSPDAVAILSWNEFSENSHVEPSTRYGNESLRALASILSATVPDEIAADSSAPGGGAGFPVRPVALLVVAFGTIAGSLSALVRRRLRNRQGVETTADGPDEDLDLDGWEADDDRLRLALRRRSDPW